MTDAHQTLASRLEEAKGPDRELDRALSITLQYAGPFAPNAKNVQLDEDDPSWLIYDCDGEECTDFVPGLTASIDAALALVERELPRWSCSVAINADGDHVAVIKFARDMSLVGTAWIARGKTPALALLSALIRALRSHGEQNHE